MVSGQETLDKIINLAVDANDKPLQPVLISRCGELEKKGKQKQKQPAVKDSAVSTDSRDRGRRRGSGDSDVDMSASAPQRPVQRHRRQSDNVIDEGLRGRPRQRSASHSPSNAIEESGESEPESASEMYKRKRSQSPSRHNAAPMPHNDENSYGQRRRRSLPNQYAEERARRNYGEEDRYRPSPRRNNNYAGRRDDDRPRQRQDDRYRPHDRFGDDGRLGGSGGRLGNDNAGGENDPPVKYKGRGSMKYREPGRL